MHKLVLNHDEYRVLQDVGRMWLLTARWALQDSQLTRLSNYTQWIATPIRWRPALALQVKTVLAPFMSGAQRSPVEITVVVQDGLYWFAVPREHEADIGAWASTVESLLDMCVIPRNRQLFARRLLDKLRVPEGIPSEAHFGSRGGDD